MKQPPLNAMPKPPAGDRPRRVSPTPPVIRARTPAVARTPATACPVAVALFATIALAIGGCTATPQGVGSSADGTADPTGGYPGGGAPGAVDDSSTGVAYGATEQRYLPRADTPFSGAAVAATDAVAEVVPSPVTGAVPLSTDAPDAAGAPPASGPCPGIAVREGGQLKVDGQPFVFFGINTHFLLDDEFPEAEVEPIVAALAARGVNTLRVWFFRRHDPDRFARLLDTGARHGVRFVVTLEDNVFKGVDWFFTDTDEEKYRPHVERTVDRFRDRPEILIWEPINEPNCGDGRHDDDCLKVLRDWLKMMAREIKSIDRCHVVSTAMIGDGNFESEEANYRNIHGIDAVEILSVHKRSTDVRATELETADDEDKPIFYGEIYDAAYDEGCNPLRGDESPEARAERIKADLRQAVDDDVDGYLLWDFAAGLIGRGSSARDYCGTYGYYLDDPLWDKLGRGSDVPPVPWRP